MLAELQYKNNQYQVLNIKSFFWNNIVSTNLYENFGKR